MSVTDTPELAIAAFERATDLTLVVHDVAGTLAQVLRPCRFGHGAPPCRAAKSVRHAACIAFDADLIREEIQGRPEGLMKICHAGFLEWVVPVTITGRLEWVLFAGLRRPSGRFLQARRDPDPVLRRSPLAHARRMRSMSESDGTWVLELLRQLAARLTRWRQEEGEAIIGIPNRPISRRHRISAFIAGSHGQRPRLADLAGELGVSVDRASHAVVELFGVTYRELLMRARLDTAAALLRETDLSLTLIMKRSGFQDASHFHRHFRRSFGMTPRTYRHTVVHEASSFSV